MDLELVSFELCPYVQRAVISLQRKKIPFKLTYIDLKSPPDWFLEVSPLGKVPVLRVDGKTSIFESAVINEFIDEVFPPSYHPSVALQKALERAWIEFGSHLTGIQFQLFTAKNKEDAGALKDRLFKDLSRLEPILKGGPYFRGSEFSLVDATYAPLFVRLLLSKEIAEAPQWMQIPKIRAWADKLLKEESVQSSVAAGFGENFRTYCKAMGSVMFT
jgi:glutathione S-transferase